MNSRKSCLPCGRAAALAALLGATALLPPGAAAQRYPVRTFSDRDGLGSSTVHDLAQDAQGRMWFLTRAGVARYDGFEWVAPDPRPPHLVLRYTLLELDPAGGAWLAAEDPSLPLLRVGAPPGEASELLAPAPGPAAAERRMALAAVTEAGGTTLALGTDEAGLHLRRGGRWTSLGAEDGLPHPAVLALEPAGSRVFVGTRGGLAVLTDGRLDPAPNRLLPPDRRDLRALAWAEGEDVLWLVGPDWVGTLSGGRFRLAADRLDIPPDPIRRRLVAEADGRGGLFFGSETRLFHLDRPGGQVAALGRRNGLAAEGAASLHLDRERNLWIASPRGVSRLGGLRFATWDATQGLLEDEVSAVAERRPGELVFGHNEGLTFYRPGEEPRTLPLAREELGLVPLGRVLDLEVEEDGTLWAAAGHLGLARVGPDGELRWFGGGAGIPERIDAVRRDRRGRLLLGTGGGLAELAAGRIVPVQEPGLGRPRIRRIVLGPDGTLYLATPDEGLRVRRPGEGWRRARGAALAEDDLFTVLVDGAGRVWVGATAGLLVLEGDRLVRPKGPSGERAPRVDRPVYALVEDPEGHLWIGTDAGVYRWDGERLDRFTVFDGLAGNEANRAAALVDGAGRLWLGTDGGVSLVRDAGGRRTLPPPRVSLLGVEVDGELSAADRSLDLAYRQNRVSFRVAAVSFRDESRITYRSRLLGHDPGWTVETGPARLELHYSALAPGAYTFEVQARSDRSRWSDVAASAPLTVARPFWLQAWFLGFGALVLVGLGFSGHRFHAQRRYARRLEREVARRTEELVKAQKLEALGVLAGGIAHDFNNLLTVILGNVSLVQASPRMDGGDHGHLEQARRALGRAQELSRRLLTFSQGGAPVTGPVPLGRVVRECADFTSRGSNVRCAVAVPEGLWPAEADEGQLSQVLNNLLINAIQAMPRGGVVTVQAANAELAGDEVAGLAAGRYVRLRVDDQGPGIPPDVLPRVFDPFFTTKEGGSGLGLATVHSIVRQHRGAVRAEAAPGGGTRFEVWLPAAAAGPRPVAVPGPARAREAGGGRVLVMDDQAAVRGVLEGMLRHLGYDVAATADGDEALAAYRDALLRRRPFDLVILDLTVPGGKGGKETLRELLRLDPEVRAIASSGYADDPVLAEGANEGFAAALPKPYTLDRLSQVLQEVLDRPARAKAAVVRGA